LFNANLFDIDASGEPEVDEGAEQFAFSFDKKMYLRDGKRFPLMMVIFLPSFDALIIAPRNHI